MLLKHQSQCYSIFTKSTTSWKISPRNSCFDPLPFCCNSSEGAVIHRVAGVAQLGMKVNLRCVLQEEELWLQLSSLASPNNKGPNMRLLQICLWCFKQSLEPKTATLAPWFHSWNFTMKFFFLTFFIIYNIGNKVNFNTILLAWWYSIWQQKLFVLSLGLSDLC